MATKVFKKIFTSGVRVHFIGIGGIGMCGLAELLYRSGVIVTGSDLQESTHTKRLKKIGISVFIGHSRSYVSPADIVVYSSAVPKSNIERREAVLKKIPLISRSEALSEIMRLKRGIVIAGTHGKTTTTGLLANIFVHNKKEPTVVVGGRSQLFQSTARLGSGEWFIAESDESDGGFKHLSPEVAVLTNIDLDHLEHYGSFENLKKAFCNFALKVPFYGFIIAWGDQKILKNLLTGLKQKVIFYGFNKDNHFCLKKLSNRKYIVTAHKQKLGILQMPLPGAMNALNTIAALAVAMSVGFSFKQCTNSFKLFKGVDRRFQKKGEKNGVEFYDDYAHHPTEIKELLEAMREKWGTKKRLVLLFQPHRFSRTKTCWKQFLTCFKKASFVFLTDIYPAGEKALKNISSQKLASLIAHKHCHYLPDKNILSTLQAVLKKGDVLVTVGAGSVYQYGEQLLQGKTTKDKVISS